MATRIADIARDDDGNPVAGANVSLRRESDNFQLATTTTDANGYFTFSEDTVRYPGPVKVVVTDADGNVRQHSGRSTGQVGTIFMSDLNRVFLMMTDGVVGGVGGQLAVSSTGLSMQVAVADGIAFVFGHPYIQAASQNVTIAANGSGNPRIDLVVIRLIPPGVTGEGTMIPAVVQGTPAGSPVAPGVTQSQSTVWEVPLAQVRVEPGVSSIAPAKLTDVRSYTSGPLQNNSVTTAKLADNAVTNPKIADNAVGLAELNAGGALSTVDTVQVFKAPTSGSTPVIATLATKELSDFSSDVPTGGQAAIWDAATSQYKPTTLPASTKPVIKEGGTTKVASADTFNFDGGDFDVSESPTGTGTITLAADSVTATEIAAGAVGSSELATNAVQSANIGALQVTAGKIAADAVTAAEIAAGAVGSSELANFAVTAGKIATNGVSNTLQITDGIVSVAKIVPADIGTGAGKLAASDHTHQLTAPFAGFATKSYTFTGVTSTATDGVEIAGFDLDVPGGGGVVIAHADAQCGAPTSGGTFIQIGVKIGTQATDWGMLTQTVSGERNCSATSTRTYASGASAQRISLRAKVDAGTGAGVNSAHINAYGVGRLVAAS